MRRTISDEKLTAYILDELNDIERKEVARALEQDPSSRQVMVELKRAAEISRLAFAGEPAPSLGLTEDQRAAVLRSAEGTTPVATDDGQSRRMSGLFDEASSGGIFGGAGADLGDSPFDLPTGIFTSVGRGDEQQRRERASAPAEPGPADDEDDDLESQTRSPRIDAKQALTGRRSENSVLFSLSNLQALAMTDRGWERSKGDGDDADESSGLIDIRALSAAISSGSEKRVEDLMSLGGAGFAPIAPPQSRTMSLWVKVGIAGGSVALAAAATFVFVFATVKGADEETEIGDRIAMLEKKIGELRSKEAAEEPLALLQEQVEEKAAPPAEKDEELEAPAAAEEADEVMGKAAYKGKKSSKADYQKSKPAGSKNKPAVQPESVKSESSASTAFAPQKKGGSDELDDLLGGTDSKTSGSSAKNPAPSSSGSAGGGGGGGAVKKTLDRDDVQKGMSAVADRVRQCGQGQSGTVTLKVIIGSTGRVVSAGATGAFAGTTVGSCAARAVKSAVFPKSQSSLTVTYPFKL